MYALSGGTWVQNWEEADRVQDLWEDFPAPRPTFCLPEEMGKRDTAVKVPLLRCLGVPAGFHVATRRVNSPRRPHGVLATWGQKM